MAFQPTTNATQITILSKNLSSAYTEPVHVATYTSIIISIPSNKKEGFTDTSQLLIGSTSDADRAPRISSYHLVLSRTPSEIAYNHLDGRASCCIRQYNPDALILSLRPSPSMLSTDHNGLPSVDVAAYQGNAMPQAMKTPYITPFPIFYFLSG